MHRERARSSHAVWRPGALRRPTGVRLFERSHHAAGLGDSPLQDAARRRRRSPEPAPCDRGLLASRTLAAGAIGRARGPGDGRSAPPARGGGGEIQRGRLALPLPPTRRPPTPGGLGIARSAVAAPSLEGAEHCGDDRRSLGSVRVPLDTADRFLARAARSRGDPGATGAAPRSAAELEPLRQPCIRRTGATRRPQRTGLALASAPRPRSARSRSGFRRPARPSPRALPSSPAAVPEEPEMIAPAWPICLPGGAVKPAM